jgi:ectoine hydroxylase-related dioxygenase (phytanoyl-CoA dioxygenase family)
MSPALDAEGCCLYPGVFATDEMRQLADDLGPVERAGIRSLLDDERVVALAQDPRLRALVGPTFFAVRALLFDKTAESNWGLRWHQDLSVAVVERRETPGFASWTIKAGVVHSLAPVPLLERMVSLRIHLDDCGPSAGPLQVVPRSHLGGRVDNEAIRDRVENVRTCVALCGDVLAFKPLLLHASASSMSSHHRRVLQLEFARDELPGGLQWRWRV